MPLEPLIFRASCRLTPFSRPLSRGFVIDTVEHTFGSGRGKAGTLTGDLEAAIKNNPNIPRGDHRAVAQAMKDVYLARGLNDLWLVTHQTLLSKGITNLPTP